MKKVFAVFLVILLFLSGCGGNKSLGVSDTLITDTDILNMKITDFSNKDIAVQIENVGKCEAGYGEPYHLEFKKDGEWHILKPKEEWCFIEIFYILEAESNCTWGTNFENFYGELPSGEYRLVKEFIIYGSNDEEGEKVNLAAQFKIG